MLKEKIKDLSKKYSESFIQIRHHLHQNPELSYHEFETSKFIQQKLKELEISFEVLATTGVVGIIKGKNPEKKIIALRADIDALPIHENLISEEVNGLAYPWIPKHQSGTQDLPVANYPKKFSLIELL